MFVSWRIISLLPRSHPMQYPTFLAVVAVSIVIAFTSRRFWSDLAPLGVTITKTPNRENSIWFHFIVSYSTHRHVTNATLHAGGTFKNGVTSLFNESYNESPSCIKNRHVIYTKCRPHVTLKSMKCYSSALQVEIGSKILYYFNSPTAIDLIINLLFMVCD